VSPVIAKLNRQLAGKEYPGNHIRLYLSLDRLTPDEIWRCWERN